jgi:DNA gyrase subunit A
MSAFELDAEQTDAILELKIYRLARLEILIIRNELEEKRKRARQINALLKDEDAAGSWCAPSSKRSAEATATSAARRSPAIRRDRIHRRRLHRREDNVVIVSRDGWVKRQKEVKDLSTTRLREGDSVLAAFAGSTRATCVFFSNFGVAYTCRFIDVPASTGYGEPIQKQFKLKDGEKIVAAMSLDPRVVGTIAPKKEATPRRCTPSAVSSDGYALRFNLDGFVEPSTRAGRRFARPPKARDRRRRSAARRRNPDRRHREARGMLCKADEVNFLSGPARASC